MLLYQFNNWLIYLFVHHIMSLGKQCIRIRVGRYILFHQICRKGMRDRTKLGWPDCRSVLGPIFPFVPKYAVRNKSRSLLTALPAFLLHYLGAPMCLARDAAEIEGRTGSSRTWEINARRVRFYNERSTHFRKEKNARHHSDFMTLRKRANP